MPLYVHFLLLFLELIEDKDPGIMSAIAQATTFADGKAHPLTTSVVGLTTDVLALEIHIVV